MTQQMPIQSLTNAQLEEVLHRNWNLLKATRQHILSLHERHAPDGYATVLFDMDGCLLDIMGNATELHWFHEWGFRIGQVFPSIHKFSSAAPIELDGQTVAWLAILNMEYDPSESAGALLHSACIAIGHSLKLEELRQDAMRVHHSLISHLDCHVILVDESDRIVEERHPIPLSDEVRLRMLDITMREDCYNEEVSMGQRTYTSDARKLWDHAGRLKGKLGIFRDITRNKTLELKVQDVEKLSMLTSLAAGIAHEIRNPLTTARGFLQLFQERLDSQEDKRFLSLTIGELDRIHRLVTDFMSLAKPVTPSYTPVNMVDVIHEVADFIHPEASLQGVIFQTAAPKEPIWVRADEHQLKQVILNVIQNALQACTSKDCVSVELTADQGQVTLCITDTGCGMSPPELARVYQPYFTTKSTGTGLGLAVSKRIIQEHGGGIYITSTVGQGTTVSIQLSELVESPTTI
jgi:signal transduction histidine kinase